jgi:GT2 family glycosyltransferase
VLAQRYPRLEVIAVDDCSTDGTAEAIAAVAAERSTNGRADRGARVTLVRGREAPDGWLGKPWAVSQGVEHARGEWLCFTDADIVFAPDTLAAALAFARERGGGGCTLTPLLVCGSFWERVVQPVAAMTIASFVAPPLLAERPRSRVALAAGGFMLVERELYERAGGHAGVRDRVADDISLARNVKRAGGLLALGAGDELLRVRMYHGGGELFRGWRKNTAYGLPGPAAVSALAALLFATAGVAPPLALVQGLRRRDARLTLRGAFGVGSLLALRASAGHYAPAPRRYVATAPLGVLWLSGVTLVAVVDRLRGGPRWRGRRAAFAR